MPFVYLKPTSIYRVFFLNALASAVILVIALYIKGRYDTYSVHQGQKVNRKTNIKSVGLTFTFTFVSALCGYFLLYYTVGYGTSFVAKE